MCLFFPEGPFSLLGFKSIFDILSYIGVYSEGILSIGDKMDSAHLALLVFCMICFDGGLLHVIEKDTLRQPKQELGFHSLYSSRAVRRDILSQCVVKSDYMNWKQR